MKKTRAVTAGPKVANKRSSGLAAGALGAAAYGLSCSLTGETHLGIWHVVPVFAMVLAGRFVVPHLVRW